MKLFTNILELFYSPFNWLKLFKKTYIATPKFFRNRWLWAFRQSCLQWFVIPMVVQHENGAKFYLSKDPIDDRVLLGIYVYFRDLYLPQSLNVPTDVLILDLGAHHGYYTIAALFNYPDIHIISVEPDPISVDLLRYNININHMNNRVDVIHGAFGKENGDGWLTRDSDGSWGNYLGGFGDASVKVQILSMKDVLRERSVFLVKCNSEGGEFFDIPNMFENGIFPNLILLFVHPDHGNEKELLQTLHYYNYDVQPLFSTIIDPRYICKKKDALV